MSSSEKKKLERHHLDRFLALLTAPFLGSIEPTEEPDFLFRRSDECIGIELTELHQIHSGAGRPLQANQAMRQRVVSRAKDIYDQAGYSPVYVSIFFNEHRPVKRSNAVWLLINCDTSFMSTWFQFDNEALTGTFRSSFDRVFLMRHSTNTLHELTVRREP